MKGFLAGIGVMACIAMLFIAYRRGNVPTFISPAPTPDPATVSLQVIAAKYPDVTKAGSQFNSLFIKFVNEDKQNDPAEMQRPDWPIIIANRVAGQITAPAPAPAVTPPPFVSALDRGAYKDQPSVPGANYVDEQGRHYSFGPDGQRVYAQ